MASTWFPALLGKIWSAGRELELSGGLNFIGALRAVTNPATGRIDVSVDPDVLPTGGAVEYANAAALRISAVPAVGAIVRLRDTQQTYRYSNTGAGFADDSNTIIKLDAVNIAANGRYFLTSGSAAVATLDALRGVVSGYHTHVHVRCHTSATDGGGDVWDRRALEIGDVDDDGTLVIAGNYAYVRRGHEGRTPTPKWWGGAADYDRTHDTGGELDDAAIHACQAYAVARLRSWFIPDGNWLLTTPIEIHTSEKFLGESFDKTVLHCKCDTPLLVPDTRQCFDVRGFALLATHADCDVAFDFWSGFNIAVDIAIGGAWSRGFQCFQDGGDRAAHGFLFVAHPLKVRDYKWTGFGVHGFASPGKSGRAIHLDGNLIDLEIAVDVNQPDEADAGVYIRNYPGGISHTIRVSGVVAGHGITELPAIGVHAIGINGISIDDLYAEACPAAIKLENCQSLRVGPHLDGSSIVLDGCKTGYVAPQQTPVLYTGCTGFTEHGAGFGTPGITGAWSSDNIDIVGDGFSKQAGGIYSKAGWTHTDGQNLCLNGDFRRWTGGRPWGWTWTLSAGATLTQCGEGLGDTTRPANTPYCMHVVCDGVSVANGLIKLTGPLGDQYLGSTVAVQVKVKRTAGHQICSITNSVGTGSGDMWLEQQTTASEDGWETFTTQCYITANEQSGLYLKILCAENSDAYIGAIDVQFGRQCPRSFNMPRVSADGTVERLPGGPIRVYSSSIPGATDPFLGKAYLAGDQAVNTAGAAPLGWRYTGSVWTPISANAEEELVEAIRRVDSSNKIACLLLGADFTGSGAWVARIGSNAAQTGAAPATVGTLRGRAAAVFATGGSSMGYGLPTNCAEYWAVGRYDGALPVTNYPSLVGGAGAGPRLMGDNGTSNLINDCTITRDGVSSVALDGLTRIWRGTDTASADARNVGSYGPNVANNWIGPIGLVLAVTSAFTAEEADAIYQLIEGYVGK